MSGLRERKKAATRAALSWAAIRLTVERGYDNVLVDDVAEAAGVSARTFNNYFSSKAEAIASRHLDRSLRLADELRARPADEPLWAAIRAAAMAQFEPGPEVEQAPPGDHADWVSGLKVMLAEPALQGEMLRAVAAAEAELAVAVAERTGTDVKQDLYPNLVAATVSAAINTVMRQFVYADSPVPMEQLLSDALSQLAAGLPVPAAR
ncbi:TetR family transcriptional regulator [Solwaraspora sp. WMMD791]|uniref:acyl-CoA-like ligand-binding transcription factor n=1 Tax=Solwaraspora sp. WMMD791 TaxID=3016086 RepID=UPI002499CC9D|nr:TetR family transcriptional regulator [Solwaraspora sp. WMMD791]WFE26472.1 TetR family transcriptional regulator [Solwaraspora sp. WMMD791]